MNRARLSILYLSQMPPSPPRFGAQARMHGLMSTLARHDDITAVSLVDDEFDLEECRRAMSEYCREVVLIRNPKGRGGLPKRVLQLRSLASSHSFEHHRYDVPELQPTLDRLLQRRRFDIVNLEFPYLAHLRLKQSPKGTPLPPLVLDTHEIAWELVRQFAKSGSSRGRRFYAALDWRKLRREEVAAFHAADGICACSALDAERIRAEVPEARTRVVPNAADVDFYQPRPSRSRPRRAHRRLLRPDDHASQHRRGPLVHREIWPRIAAVRPEALCKIIGSRPPRSVLDLAGPRVT